MKLNDVLAIIASHEDEIRRHHVVTLSIFGSVARDEARSDSDIDMLVEFDQPATYDLYFALKEFLEAVLDHPVDLVTSKALRPPLRPYIEKDLFRVA